MSGALHRSFVLLAILEYGSIGILAAGPATDLSFGHSSIPSFQSASVARPILTDPNLPLVLDKARSLLKTGFTAGSGYGEVWIRDLNTPSSSCRSR